MDLLRTALRQQAGMVLGIVIGAVLFGGGFIAAMSVMDADASHEGDGVVHACINRYTGQARFIMPGRAPNCTPSETQVDLGNGAGAAGLEARIAALEAANLDTRVAALEIQVPDCLSAPEEHLALFSGCNVQIVNGEGDTETTNELGNLIVGYNKNEFGASRSGSHNLVVGDHHEYSSFGGFVAGVANTIVGQYASVSGGEGNTASGDHASVSGGYGNIASANHASVSGGFDNVASGLGGSSVSGGNLNVASGPYASVSGGVRNTASDWYSSVSGGIENVASQFYASVSGGSINEASGAAASVGGGNGQIASGAYQFLP